MSIYKRGTTGAITNMIADVSTAVLRFRALHIQWLTMSRSEHVRLFRENILLRM